VTTVDLLRAVLPDGDPGLAYERLVADIHRAAR
jgi:hypothetical protein